MENLSRNHQSFKLCSPLAPSLPVGRRSFSKLVDSTSRNRRLYYKVMEPTSQAWRIIGPDHFLGEVMQSIILNRGNYYHLSLQWDIKKNIFLFTTSWQILSSWWMEGSERRDSLRGHGDVGWCPAAMDPYLIQKHCSTWTLFHLFLCNFLCLQKFPAYQHKYHQLEILLQATLCHCQPHSSSCNEFSGRVSRGVLWGP